MGSGSFSRDQDNSNNALFVWCWVITFVLHQKVILCGSVSSNLGRYATRGSDLHRFLFEAVVTRIADKKLSNAYIN